MRLLVVATHLRPAQGYGGVAQSTAELIIRWRSEGKVVPVLTSDASASGKVSAKAFRSVLLGEVESYTPWTSAARWGFALRPLRQLWIMLRSVDVAYISGIATWPTTCAAILACLVRRPYVIALRGGLMPGHWSDIQRHNKVKLLYYKVLTIPSVRRAAWVHVTSEEEARGLKAVAPDASSIIIPNSLTLPPFTGEITDKTRLKLLFIGRLAPEKGICNFLSRFQVLAGENDTLSVVGMGSGAYAERIREIISADPRYVLIGELRRSEVEQALGSCSGLVLPSGMDSPHRENFGNVVVEALGAGRPVLICRGLAWDDLVQAGVGITMNPDGSDLPLAVEKLRALCREPGIEKRCRDFATRHFSSEVVPARLWSALEGTVTRSGGKAVG